VITRDSIKRHVIRLWGLDLLDKGGLEALLGGYLWFALVYFTAKKFESVAFAILMFSIWGICAIPVAKLMLYLIGASYRGIVALYVRLIPKDEEEAYSRKMARQEKKKKKKNLDTSRHNGIDYDLSAYGNDRYYIAEEDPVQKSVK
jgi:hypothetical protein